MALIDLAGIAESLLRRILGPTLSRLIDQIKHFGTQLKDVFTNVQKLIDSVKAEVEGWRTFREHPDVKHRVINIPKAYEKTRDLIVGVADSWHAALDIVKQFKEKLTTSTAVEDTEAAVSDAEEGGLSSILKQFPKFAKIFEKVLGIFTLIIDALESILSVIDDLQTIVDEMKRVREEIESADSIFLGQKNPRKVLKLKDGGSIRIRVGSLHKA